MENIPQEILSISESLKKEYNLSNFEAISLAFRLEKIEPQQKKVPDVFYALANMRPPQNQ